MILDCQSQVRIGFNGVIGFDFTAILHMAELRGIDAEAASVMLPFADAGLRLGLARLQLEKRDHGTDSQP